MLSLNSNQKIVLSWKGSDITIPSQYCSKNRVLGMIWLVITPIPGGGRRSGETNVSFPGKRVLLKIMLQSTGENKMPWNFRMVLEINWNLGNLQILEMTPSWTRNRISDFSKTDEGKEFRWVQTKYHPLNHTWEGTGNNYESSTCSLQLHFIYMKCNLAISKVNWSQFIFIFNSELHQIKTHIRLL